MEGQHSDLVGLLFHKPILATLAPHLDICTIFALAVLNRRMREEWIHLNVLDVRSLIRARFNWSCSSKRNPFRMVWTKMALARKMGESKRFNCTGGCGKSRAVSKRMHSDVAPYATCVECFDLKRITLKWYYKGTHAFEHCLFVAVAIQMGVDPTYKALFRRFMNRHHLNLSVYLMDAMFQGGRAPYLGARIVYNWREIKHMAHLIILRYKLMSEWEEFKNVHTRGGFLDMDFLSKTDNDDDCSIFNDGRFVLSGSGKPPHAY